MGGRSYRGTKDGRSALKTRVGALTRRLLAGFPLDPDRSMTPGPVRAADIRQLIDVAHRHLREPGMRSADLSGFTLVTTGYRTFLSELIENRNDIGGKQGVYVIHEAGGLQRALYIGSTWRATFRARLVSHLLPEGSLRRLGGNLVAGLDALVDDGHTAGEIDERRVDRKLRQVLFGENRWVAARFASTPEEAHAVDLISVGAFDITLFVLPPTEVALAQFIEVRLVRECATEYGQVPPLQRAEVNVTNKAIIAADDLGVQPELLHAPLSRKWRNAQSAIGGSHRLVSCAEGVADQLRR